MLEILLFKIKEMFYYGRKKNKEKKTHSECCVKKTYIMYQIMLQSRGKTSVVIEKKSPRRWTEKKVSSSSDKNY